MIKVASLLLFIMSLSAFAGSERLVGTWKSNKDATLAYLKIHTSLTSPQLDLVARSLGKTTFTFDKANVTMESDSWKFISPYKIISETTNSMTIESQDPGTQKPTQTVLEFDSTGFWTPDDRIPGYKERFDKLAQK
jgi:hypothetical protein